METGVAQIQVDRCGWDVWMNRLCFLWKQDQNQLKSWQNEVCFNPFFTTKHSTAGTSLNVYWMSLHLYSILQLGKQEWEGAELCSSLFWRLGWAPFSTGSKSFLSLLCLLCQMPPLSIPTDVSSEDEEQRWNSSGSTVLYHKSPPRVSRERTDPLPKFLTMKNSLLAYSHF